MSDYIIHNKEQFKGCTVLELGAGVGVVSIVTCLAAAKTVLCTGLNISHDSSCSTSTLSLFCLYLSLSPFFLSLSFLSLFLFLSLTLSLTHTHTIIRL